MNRRAALMALFAAVPAFCANPPNDIMSGDWEKFAADMNCYVEGLNKGVNNLATLKRALKAWRRLEKDMGWSNL